MEQGIWTYITAILSIGFGWLLNEISQLLRGRKEDKKIKKKVLFYLLELYFTLKQLDIKPFIDIVTGKISERLPKDEQDENSKRYLAALYQHLIGNLREKETAERIIELDANYKKSLEDLSSVDPIAAYKLFGENEFFKIIDMLSNYSNSLKNEFPHDTEDINKQTQSIIEFIKPEFLSKTLESLEDKIRKISSSVGVYTRYRAVKAINKQKEPLDESQFKTLTMYLDAFMPKQ
ncbi:hypothetical protein ACUNWD_18890 [Sunxiuqinia sp. A32]|uniref:hypothetical protein n=1 Tax=Sunxiuqinia sp. A32 TaxID=3461496 RepID=UPI00404645AF